MYEVESSSDYRVARKLCGSFILGEFHLADWLWVFLYAFREQIFAFRDD